MNDSEIKSIEDNVYEKFRSFFHMDEDQSRTNIEKQIKKEDIIEEFMNADDSFYETLEIKINDYPMTVCRGLFHNVFPRHSCENMKQPYDLIVGYDDYRVPEYECKKMVASLMTYAVSRKLELFDFINTSKIVMSFYITLHKHDLFKELQAIFRDKMRVFLLPEYNMYALLAYGISDASLLSEPIKKIMINLFEKLHIKDCYNVGSGSSMESRITIDTGAAYKCQVGVIRKFAILQRSFVSEHKTEYTIYLNDIIGDENYWEALMNGYKNITNISQKMFKHYILLCKIGLQNIDISEYECANMYNQFKAFNRFGDGTMTPFKLKCANPLYTK